MLLLTYLDKYRSQGANEFDVAQGEKLWSQPFIDEKTGKERSCRTCHTNKLEDAGKHIRTGKLIKAMSPPVNPERFTDSKKVEKWFLRNCKWTLGRKCNPQEKGEILSFLSNK